MGGVSSAPLKVPLTPIRYEQLQEAKRGLATASDENRKLRTDIQRLQSLVKRKDAEIKGVLSGGEVCVRGAGGYRCICRLKFSGRPCSN